MEETNERTVAEETSESTVTEMNESPVAEMETIQTAPDAVKEARKHFSKLGLMYFLGTLIIQALQYGTLALVKHIRPEWLEDPNISIVLMILPMYLLGMPALIALVKQVPAEKIEPHHMKGGHFALSVMMGYAVMIVSNIAGLIVTVIISLVKGGLVQNEMVNLTSSANVLLLFFFTVCCAPLYEEYIFRKLIVDRTVRYGQGVAVLTSGLMFGLFHGNFNQFVYAFSLGTFLAFLYVKTGKLKITVGIHMIVNFVGGVLVPSLLKLLNFDRYFEIVRDGMDTDALMAYYMDNLWGWMIYFCFMLCVFGVVVAGGVLLIVSLVQKKFRFDRGRVSIPKGKRFSTVILNLGMLLFTVTWILMIALQLFA